MKVVMSVNDASVADSASHTEAAPSRLPTVTGDKWMQPVSVASQPGRHLTSLVGCGEEEMLDEADWDGVLLMLAPVEAVGCIELETDADSLDDGDWDGDAPVLSVAEGVAVAAVLAVPDVEWLGVGIGELDSEGELLGCDELLIEAPTLNVEVGDALSEMLKDGLALGAIVVAGEVFVLTVGLTGGVGLAAWVVVVMHTTAWLKPLPTSYIPPEFMPTYDSAPPLLLGSPVAHNACPVGDNTKELSSPVSHAQQVERLVPA
jgi:hypothetical protein